MNDLHLLVASILTDFFSSRPGYRVLFAPECGGTYRLPLYSSDRACRETNYCWIDALIIDPQGNIIAGIEIEQSGNPTPEKVNGKLFRIAPCRFGPGQLPLNRLAVIQAVNTERLPAASKKPMQYTNLEADNCSLLPVGCIGSYVLVAGAPADFAPGGVAAQRIVTACQALVG